MSESVELVKQKVRPWKQADAEANYVKELFEQAAKGHYYGKLIFIMEDGQLKRVVREESIKPPKHSEKL